MIWLASDHAGVELKDMVKAELGRLSKKYEDLGANSHEPTDYPPLAHQVARKVSTEPNGTEAVEMVREWLKTPFSDAERHVRRTQQIDES